MDAPRQSNRSRGAICYDRAPNRRTRRTTAQRVRRSTESLSTHRGVSPERSPIQSRRRRPRRLGSTTALAALLGAATGLALATYGLLEARSIANALPATTAAVVGERTIRTVDYQRVLAGVEGDLRSPVDDALRRRVLDRMIDEELLVQRALDLGLAVVDRRVRGELTSGLIDSIVSEADAEEATAREVEKHYKKNLDFFTRPGRLRVQTLFFSVRGDGETERPTAARRASLAADRLGRLDDAAAVEHDLADSQVSPVPNALLPATKVRDYVGPTLLERLAELDVGVWSPPIKTPSGFHIGRLLEREPAVVPEFESIEKLVRQDLKRRRGDEALRTYLDDLRGEVAVLVNDSVFDTGE